MSEPVQNPDAGEARERNSRETQPQESADARDTAETQDTAEAQPSGTVNRYPVSYTHLDVYKRQVLMR